MQHIRCRMDAQVHATQPARFLRQNLAHLVARDLEAVGDGGLRVA